MPSRPFSDHGLAWAGRLSGCELEDLILIVKREKQDWCQLIIDLSWAPEQIPGILDYNEADVLATTQLLHKMMPLIDFPRALGVTTLNR